jgi:hypothetical protein
MRGKRNSESKTGYCDKYADSEFVSKNNMKNFQNINIWEQQE